MFTPTCKRVGKLSPFFGCHVPNKNWYSYVCRRRKQILRTTSRLPYLHYIILIFKQAYEIDIVSVLYLRKSNLPKVIQLLERSLDSKPNVCDTKILQSAVESQTWMRGWLHLIRALCQNIEGDFGVKKTWTDPPAGPRLRRGKQNAKSEIYKKAFTLRGVQAFTTLRVNAP